MRLSAIAEPYRPAIAALERADGWRPQDLADLRGAPWLAFNVAQDDWLTAKDIAEAERYLEAEAIDPSAHGTELLDVLAKALPLRRELSDVERARVPDVVFNHVGWRYHSARYKLTSDDAYAESTLPSEPPWSAPPGDFQVELTKRLLWITFEVGAALPARPDPTVRSLGLPWGTGSGDVVRVRIDWHSLASHGVRLYIPTLLDGLPPKFESHWRAVPSVEKNPSAPWGHTRDLDHGGPAWPELLLEIPCGVTLIASNLGLIHAEAAANRYLDHPPPK